MPHATKHWNVAQIYSISWYDLLFVVIFMLEDSNQIPIYTTVVWCGVARYETHDCQLAQIKPSVWTVKWHVNGVCVCVYVDWMGQNEKHHKRTNSFIATMNLLTHILSPNTSVISLQQLEKNKNQRKSNFTLKSIKYLCFHINT